MDVLQVLLIIDLTIALLALITHLENPNDSRRSFHIVLTFFISFVLYHLTYVFISKTFFPVRGWVENSAPFGLMYGPFIYFFLESYITDRTPKRVIWHIMPYLVFWIIQVGFLIFQLDHNSPLAEIYMRILYGLIPVSLLIYGVWGWQTMKKFRSRIKIAFYMVLFLFIVGLFVLAIYFIKAHFESSSVIDAGDGDIVGFAIYALLLIILILIYRGSNARKPGLITPDDNSLTIPDKIIDTHHSQHKQVKDSVSSGNYKKSGLSSVDLDNYEIKLDEIISKEKLWLDSDLKLDGLADALKIPSHHLTQLLSVRKNKNYNEYINNMRIDHACVLLKKNINTNISFAEIGYQCGFNSKTTFYRWFKQIKQMTPAEYQTTEK